MKKGGCPRPLHAGPCEPSTTIIEIGKVRCQHTTYSRYRADRITCAQMPPAASITPTKIC